MDKNSILKHIDPQDKILYAKALDKVVVAEKTNTPAFSDFFDPFKISQLKQIAEANFNVTALPYGGYAGCERSMLGFFTEYCTQDTNLFPIDTLEISYNEKYSRKLTHRDFLGSVLGLGLKREKVGDIILKENTAIVFMHSSVSDFVVSNLEKVGHTKVKTQQIYDFYYEDKPLTEKKITTASLRLDGVLSSAFNISRGKASELIKGEKAFINWCSVTNGAKAVCENDMITLRGFGRVKIVEICGKTKKDRQLINIAVY